MDDALQRRLDAIERRQYLVIGLLVLPYLLAVGGYLLQTLGFRAVIAMSVGIVFLLFAGVMYYAYRARHPSGR